MVCGLYLQIYQKIYIKNIYTHTDSFLPLAHITRTVKALET